MINSLYQQYEPFFGSWYLKEYLGGGSFGQVFLVEKKLPHRKKGPLAALKIISLPQSPSELENLRQNYEVDEQAIYQHYEKIAFQISKEIELMSKLRGSPHIVDYEDHEVIPRQGEIGWDILIRMEYLTPLPKKLKEQKILSWQEIAKIGRDICQALETCQAQQILHRDIKPANILVNEAGEYKLGDFGISRSIEAKAEADFQLTYRVGTLSYMAPEVYNLTENFNYGTTADLYSLGLVLYRLLNNNRLPFVKQEAEPLPDSTEEREAFIKRMKGEALPSPCQAPPSLAAVILRACAFEVAERYQSPQQMRNDLEQLLAEENWDQPISWEPENTKVPDYQEEETVQLPRLDFSEEAGSVYPGLYRWERKPSAAKKKLPLWLKNTLTVLLGLSAILVSVWLIFIVVSQKNLQYVEAEEIVLNCTELTLALGEKEQLDCTVYPQHAAEQKVKWSSSNPQAVSVSANGEVKAVGLGESAVLVSNGEVSLACQVTVAEKTIPVNKVTLLQSSLPASLAVGQSYAFKARILPVNASNQAINWQVDQPEIASIAADGTLTALQTGSVVVSAEADGFSDSWQFNLTEGLGVWQKEVRLVLGESEVLLPIPEKAEVSYVSQNEDIATVNSRGKVTAVGVGETRITLISGDLSADCPVRVTDKKIESLQLNLTNLSLTVGDKRNLQATVVPASGGVRWSSDNILVAMVSQSGKITANSPGAAVITAKAGDLEASCQITVKADETALESIALSPDSLYLETGNRATLTLETIPTNAEVKNIIWSSKNANIAAVSNGRVTAKDFGTTSITATVSGKAATCLVTVVPANFAYNVESTVSGKITELEAQEILITSGSTPQSYALSAKTNVLQKDQSLSLDSLAVGMEVILGLDDDKQVVQIILP